MPMTTCARSMAGGLLCGARLFPPRARAVAPRRVCVGGGGVARPGRPARVARASASDDSPLAPPPWRDDVLEKHSLLGNVCFVLCAPQGPQNVGSTARVMQNFGVYDLRIVDPGPFVVGAEPDEGDDATAPADGASSRGGINSGAFLGPDGLGADLPPALRPTLPTATDDDEGAAARDGADPSAPAPLCAEAYRFACAADWLLADARRCDTHLEALEDCTFVMATTARPRGNVPLVTARVAAKMLAEEARRGKVAVLFGNERTGLTNEELAQAHACVAIPTAGQGQLCRKSLKYTGGTGPTSLNLSQAVGVLAYEMFMAADEVAVESAVHDAEGAEGAEAGASSASTAPRGVNAGRIDLPASQLMTVGEKDTLKRELLAARRSLDVLADAEDGPEDVANDDDDASSELDGREDRGIERVLHSAPLARRDAAALFQLARRVKAARVGSDSNRGLLDDAVVACARRLADEAEREGKPPPTLKRARGYLRSELGLSLTNREISRALRAAQTAQTAEAAEAASSKR